MESAGSKKTLLADMLDIIQTNPYRLLGVYSNSPTKERVANYNRLKAFLKVGKPVSFQLDLPSLFPTVNRTADTVAEADAKLALPNEQLRYAQFWFAKVTPMDDIAMNHLIAGSVENALSIWEKKENASSLQNRIVCALIQNDYNLAFTCADKLYSIYSADFANMVLGENHTVITEKLEYGFLDELCSSVGAQQILPYLSLNNEWKQYVGSKTVKPLIESLQSAVDATRASKGEGITVRYNAGVKLANETKATLMQLKTLLSVTDLQYQMIADKLGLEILQCGIDYYNGSEAVDAARKAMKLQSYALSVVVGKMAKDRCKENVNILQTIIDNLPPEEVFTEDKTINEELRRFCQLPDRISHAVALLNNTKPHLQSIKVKLGASNSFYLKLSTQVVGNALHNIIEEVNAVQKDETVGIGGNQIPISMLFRETKINQIKSTLRAAWDAIKIMDTFDMESNFKMNRYNQNRSILKEICDQLGVPTTTYVPRPSIPRPSATPHPSVTRTSPSSNRSQSKNSSKNNPNVLGCIVVCACAIIGAIIGGAITGDESTIGTVCGVSAGILFGRIFADYLKSNIYL